MSPFQTNDYSAGNVLMDPRWTTMSQCYGQQQEMFDLEKRALMHDNTGTYTAHKIKFSIMDFFSKCDHIHNILRIYSYSLRKFIMKDIIFCVMLIQTFTLHRTLIISCIMLKMVICTLKVLRWEHRKIFKVGFTIFNIMHERFNPFNASPKKWSSSLKQFVGNSRQIVWVHLTILCG